ncbi:hypothetical protein Hanom_Chr16g01477261 [Helianthus anomalus]
MATRSFYHWADINAIKKPFSRWSLQEQRTGKELNRKVGILSENYYKQTCNSISLLDEVVNSTPLEFKDKAEEFITQLLKQV